MNFKGIKKYPVDPKQREFKAKFAREALARALAFGKMYPKTKGVGL